MPKQWLKQTLILSLGLNGVLVALFFYIAYFGPPSKQSYTYLPTEINLNKAEILPDLSFEELILALEESSRRDSALATLVQLHAFDLERACGRRSARRLGDDEFKAVINFAKQEVYPFTTEGLYKRLPEASEVFVATPEFVQLEILFKRSGVPIPRQTLLTLIAEGRYETLADYNQAQRAGANYGQVRRRDLLLDYVHDGSRTAAYLLLLTDVEFAQNELMDDEVSDILQLLNVKTMEATQYANAIFTSSRSEVCKKKAYDRLCQYQGAQKHPLEARHLVKNGESLWTIAKQHNISIEQVKVANALASDTIQPGMTLKIPYSTGS